jgi:undecaprenyl-diphosphatase
MSVYQAFVLGLTQGLTEFLPISSSAHLIIIPWLFNWHYLLDHPDFNKTFDVALHAGTFVAVLVYFWRDVVDLLRAWFGSIARRSIRSPRERLVWLILVSTVPAGFFGVAFEEVVEDRLGAPYLIAILMAVFALALWLADRYAKLQRDLQKVTFIDAVVIGFAQAIALAPGVSRSGITMLTGMARGFTRESAARYSFLMSIPVIGGAAAYKAVKHLHGGLPPGSAAPFLVGMATAAVSGFVAVWFLLAYLRRHDFTPFVIYRVAAAIAIMIIIAAGLRAASGV